MEKREERRHHLRRMKAKARRVAKYSWGYISSYRDRTEKLEELLKRAEKWANHLKMCSCEGCRNPRRSAYFKGEVTRQECLAYLLYLEGIGADERVKHCRYRKVGPNEGYYRADTGGSCEDGPRHQ